MKDLHSFTLTTCPLCPWSRGRTSKESREIVLIEESPSLFPPPQAPFHPTSPSKITSVSGPLRQRHPGPPSVPWSSRPTKEQWLLGEDNNISGSRAGRGRCRCKDLSLSRKVSVLFPCLWPSVVEFENRRTFPSWVPEWGEWGRKGVREDSPQEVGGSVCVCCVCACMCVCMCSSFAPLSHWAEGTGGGVVGRLRSPAPLPPGDEIGGSIDWEGPVDSRR